MNRVQAWIGKWGAYPRQSFAVLALLVFSAVSGAPQGAGVTSRFRIVVVKTRDVPFYAPALDGLTKGLKTRGYRPGDRIEIKVVALSGKTEADTGLVREQLGKHPRLVVTLGTDATRLVAEQKPEMPVLFSMILDPVSLGVVKSLEEPGGNFTGTTLLLSPGKQLESLLQACPKARRIGVLYTEKDPTSTAFIAEAETDAKRLNVEIVALAVKPEAASKDALSKLKGKVDTLWLIPDPASTGVQELKDTLDFAKANHLPILGASGGTVRAGALLALSAKLEDLGDMTAEMVAHVLDGTETTAKMRVRGPRRTLLAVNLDSARALGISFPGAMLSLADEVVDSQKDSSE